MCVPPVIQMVATPSQPVLPYEALQTSTRPLVGRQFFGLAPPATMVVSSTLDWLQSLEAVTSIASHCPDTLSPNFIVKGFAVRAQWYPFHEWFAYTDDGKATNASIVIATTTNTNVFFFAFIFKLSS